MSSGIYDNTLISERLKNWFRGKKISEIAEKIGITSRQLSNILRGVSPPSAKVLHYIATQNGDANYILTGKNASIDTLNDGLLQELMAIWPKLTKSERAEIYKTAAEINESKRTPEKRA